MKATNLNQEIHPMVKSLGLTMSLVLYFLLSSFSLYELIHLSEIITTDCLKFKTVCVFIIAVVIPVYMVFIESTLKLFWLKLIMELTPLVIIISLYILSIDEIPPNKYYADLISILISDVISSLILYLFEKLLHAKRPEII